MSGTEIIAKQTVPGPGLLEFLGGANEFPAFHFHSLMAKYGDIVRCGPYFYLINHPDMAKVILNRDQKDFSQEDFIGKRVRTVFGHGMVTSKDEVWSSQRRLLNPVFSSKEVHLSITEAINEIDRCLSEWENYNSNNNTVDLVDRIGTLSILTAGELLFHTDFKPYVATMKRVVKAGTTYIAEGLPFYVPKWIPTPNNIMLPKITRKTNSILEQVIDQNKDRSEEYSDLVQTLTRALGHEKSTDFEKTLLIDELKTMLAGGYFPVTCALSLIFYSLGGNPSNYAEIKQEIRSKPKAYRFTPNFYNDFPKTTASIFEAMRLYPAAFSIWRKAKCDFSISGYTIPKGKSVCISLFNVHRHPDYWTDPDEFNPDRFLSEESKRRPKHAFMPFGWGNRKCIGDHYAMMIIYLTVIRSLNLYEIDIIHEPLKVRRAALICPKRVLARVNKLES